MTAAMQDVIDQVVQGRKHVHIAMSKLRNQLQRELLDQGVDPTAVCVIFATEGMDLVALSILGSQGAITLDDMHDALELATAQKEKCYEESRAKTRQ